MKKEYKEWIDTYLLSNNPYGQCSQATLKMSKEFPELIRCRGHYFDMIWGEREHWWLKTSEDDIIDPTVTQFPTQGQGDYEEWDETREEPIGKCMNCGNYCYKSDGFGDCVCSEDCYNELKIHFI